MLPNPLEHRNPDHPVEELFVRRWSPRAMSGESVTRDELNRLFEAARWAPSTYNEQEWRFLYAVRGTDHFDTFMGLLVDFNRQWCKNAGALIVLASHTVFERNGKPNEVHSLDAGAAAQNLALQGAAMGLVVHGMAGFDRDAARRELAIPGDYAVQAMYAVGHPGDPKRDLPPEIAGQEKVSGRKPVAEIAREGKFA